MEGRPGVSASHPRNRGVTLPGYRVGPVRYDVRLAPQDGPGAILPSRRCSEGDLATARKNCVLVEDVALDDSRDAHGHTSLRPLVNNGPTSSSLRHLGSLGAIPQGLPASPIPLKEAHSLVSHKLTIPGVSPLLPPVSPRPPAGRRSFNASPRPWVSPATLVVPSGGCDNADNRGSDNTGDKYCGVGGRWRVAPTDGVSVQPKSSSDTSPLKLSPCPPEASRSTSLWGGARPAPPINSAADATTFRSEATILVTQGDDSKATGRPTQGTRSPICRRRGVGTLSLSSHEGVGMGAQRTAAPGAAAGGAAVVEEVRADGLPTPAAKYMCCVAGRSPRQLVPRSATMFSYSGPPRPAIPEEPASAHLTSDQCSAQPPTPPTHAHGRTVQSEVFSGGGGGSVATGGSGHGDRVAPPEPVTPQDNSGVALSGSKERKSRRLGRPRPEIDNLYRRWAALLPSDAGLESRKHKPQQEGVGGHGGVGPSGWPAGPSDEGARALTSPDLSPTSGGPPESPDDSADSQTEVLYGIAARSRPGDITGVLGGGRKEGGRGPPPSRPPRSRQDHLESLRKCTERLKSPSPDKRTRADSAPPTDTSSASKNPEGIPPRTKGKGRNNEPRSVMSRHPSVAKSPSLPPQLPSAKDASDSKASALPSTKDQKEAAPKGSVHDEEEEDTSKEDVAKLPPRPPPDVPPRIIQFRTASVLQVETRKGKSPTAICLYPVCNKNYSNTLPRCRPVVANKEEERTQDGPEGHPLLTTAASISDMTNVGAKSGSSQPEKLENKSKSESELSRANESGAPKVDLLVKDLRENARARKADSKEELDGKGEWKGKPKHLDVNEIDLRCDKIEGKNEKDSTSEGARLEVPTKGVVTFNLGNEAEESVVKTVPAVDLKTDATKGNIQGKNTSDCVDQKDVRVVDLANSNSQLENLNKPLSDVDLNLGKSVENVDKEKSLSNSTQRRSVGDPEYQGLTSASAPSTASAPSSEDEAKTRGSDSGDSVAGMRTSVEEMPCLRSDANATSAKKDSTTEAPVFEGGDAFGGRGAGGDIASPEMVLGSGIEGHSEEDLGRGRGIP